ncbi:unnamed protein product [Caenorhabditis sp. 36 PRJEB53466]|nr:unnamed protein product [Caenorhabditis sp. 36 PRJEB53466]
MMPRLTRIDISEPVCNQTGYDTLTENLKYFAIAAYSIPGFLMNFRMIWVILVVERGVYMAQPFFVLFALDVGVASLSLFSSISLISALIIITTSTLITLFKMSTLKNRLIQTERLLCFATTLTNFAFSLMAISQVYFLFFNADSQSEWSSFFYFLNDVSYDVLDVGSVLIILFVSAQLRGHFFRTNAALIRSTTVQSLSTSQ